MVPSEMIEEDLQQELTEVKKRLVDSETARAQAVREFANIKYLLNQILLVEHFAVFDEVAAPLPPNWCDDLVHCTEVEASHSKFASQLDQAEQEIAWREADLETSRDLRAELARAKDDIHILQIDLRLQETSSQQEIAALRTECATAKEEIRLLQRESTIRKEETKALQTKLDLVQAQYDSTRNQIDSIRNQIENLEAVREAYSSELFHVKNELSRYHEDHEEKLKVLAEVAALKTETEALAVELESLHTELSAVQISEASLRETVAGSQADLGKLRVDLAIAEENLECMTGDAAALRTEVASLRDEKRLAMESLHTAGAKLQGQIESLKLQLRDSEARNSQLQKARIELAIAKEALKWISSDALSAELEAIRLQLPYCLTSLPHFVGSWMKQFERDCLFKEALEKMKALEDEVRSYDSSLEEVSSETYFQVDSSEKRFRCFSRTSLHRSSNSHILI